MTALDAEIVAANVSAALHEDIGGGDLTAGLIEKGARSAVSLLCRDDAVICGRPWFDRAIYAVEPDADIRWRVQEGQMVAAGSEICQLNGASRGLLTAERTAMNFLQLLSATATLARRYVDAVAGTGVRILDTRKTIPGLRLAQKYAVRCGGAANHRVGLYDAVLIKENHIAAAGSIAAAVQQAIDLCGDVKIEVEVETLSEMHQALSAGARYLLLDNFSVEQLKAAVQENDGRARLEASGGVTLETIRQIAETGVDDISVGQMTKDVTAIDLSMRFSPA